MQESVKNIVKKSAMEIFNCSYKEDTLDILKFIRDYPA